MYRMHPRLLYGSLAAKTAGKLAEEPWNSDMVVELIQTLAEHGNLQDIQPPGQRLLSKLMPLVRDPVPRALCLDSGVAKCVTHESLCKNYKSTEDLELAVKPKSGLEALILGSIIESEQFDRATISKLKSSHWVVAFETALSLRNYSMALFLWKHKSHLPRVPLTSAMYTKFAELIGQHRDLKTMKEISSFDLCAPSSSGSAAACLNCITNWRELLWTLQQNEHWLHQILIIQDARHASELLASRIVDILKATPHCSTFIGNILLQGIYRLNSSQVVLQVYRTLASNHSFVGDSMTARILINASYRLGNSKILSNDIYNEFKSTKLDRQFFETWLMCQFIGRNYQTSLYVIAEMFRRQIPLRKHIQRTIFNKFDKIGNTGLVVDITKPKFSSKYPSFDLQCAISESVAPEQAKANSLCFITGLKKSNHLMGSLEEMLKFDKDKAKKNANKKRGLL